MARNQVITGVFSSTGEAEHARQRLVEAGVAENRIGVSTDLTADGIAAECPGQSYSNQPGQDSQGIDVDPSSDAVHGGTCVVSVDLGGSADSGRVEQIMRQCGAQPHTSVH
ncbi:MAG: hypothetical protein ROZ37_04930 [Aromatoleum sp.]|jgi:hypothetical protein|uniref:hypothetical protein n=1 Tax=Aromatoleum sp. TaxID=2307007 RepID=UPI002895168A|nr:hypothetical protein [Aromatoleum sp.]MDT3669662.1 hypothetical protein [Aromatoleum sp.]